MGERGELFSRRVTKGTRTYFLNVKENRSGDLFLNLVESRERGEGQFDRHSIIIYDDVLEAVYSEMRDVVDVMRKYRDRKEQAASRPPSAAKRFRVRDAGKPDSDGAAPSEPTPS